MTSNLVHGFFLPLLFDCWALHTVVYCEAVRSAILATAWLLVSHDTWRHKPLSDNTALPSSSASCRQSLYTNLMIAYRVDDRGDTVRCVCVYRRWGWPRSGLLYRASVPAVHARLYGETWPRDAFLPSLLLPSAVEQRRTSLLSTSLRPTHLPVCWLRGLRSRLVSRSVHKLLLTLWRPLLPYGYRTSCVRPG